MKPLTSLLFLLTAHAATLPGVRILVGMTDREPTKWDGGVSAKGAEISSLEPWRFDSGDAIHGTDWTISTRLPRVFNGGAQMGSARIPIAPNGVIVRLSNSSANAELAVNTTQGAFNFKLADIPYGKVLSLMNDRIRVDLVPPVEQITNDPQEQDFPAAACAPDGTVWIAYMQFVHNQDHDRLRAPFRAAPSDFSALQAPAGGDQILAMSYRSGVWSAPVEITKLGGDLYRPAIAIDGSGRPWIFWSQNARSNFDLWARPIEKDNPGKPVRLTTESGADIDPVATTDSKGRVWVGWQAWRNGHAAIQFSSQTATGFTAPKPVAPSSGNQWNASIAADSNGRVSIAWDTYESGNYDVMMRTAANGIWAKVQTVAATSRYEAYPSLAYDPAGRLWVAYEEGADRWGKDFGAYSSTGIALYQGRAIRLRGFQPDGTAIKTASDHGEAITGVMSYKLDDGHQNDSDAWLYSDPKRAERRRPNVGTANYSAPKNTSPRLAIDQSGRIWLAYRSINPIWWNPLGTVWFEYVVSYDGSQWTAPNFLSHSDNVLDNRPALVSPSGGELLIVNSSDNRSQFQLALERGSREVTNGLATLVTMPVTDPYNNDLFANRISLGAAKAKLETSPAPAPSAPTVTPDIQAEREAIARLRAYRIPYSGQALRIVRGEFHRHSETSVDGAMDGSLIDQWRYILDAGGLDWVGCCDHDNGGGREYTWWLTQKETDLYNAPNRFTALFSYERSVAYPEGHRNVLFAQRGIRVLPRLPKMADASEGRAPDTQMLYQYLKHFNGVAASHTSATTMGTDWRDNDPIVETSVEVFQGDRQSYEKPGAPRSSSANDSIGGYRPKGYIDRALEMGYVMAFESSSDHVSTHMSFANVLTTANTREAIMDAFRKRHMYAASDNILAEFSCGQHIMGDVFETNQPPAFNIHLVGTAAFSKIVVVKDNQYVYSQEPKTADVKLTWRDMSPQPGKKSYYYVRGEQADGEIVWASPMWITYTGK